MAASRILVVRLGAMGDILHALPAAASLRQAWPGARISWAVHPKWRDLLEGGGAADELIFVERSTLFGLMRTWRNLRRQRFDLAVDFQGLIQSALVASFARAGRIYGYEVTQIREKLAAHLYTDNVHTEAHHVVDRNLEIAGAAGAMQRVYDFPLPPGRFEGQLPAEPFILASPFAGWNSKQWPLEHYRELARLTPGTRHAAGLERRPRPRVRASFRGWRYRSPLQRRRPYLGHSPCRRRGGRGQRTASSRRRARQARGRHLRPYGSWAQWPLFQANRRTPGRRGRNHLRA